MSGAILLECVPRGVDLEDIKHDLETVCFSHSPSLHANFPLNPPPDPRRPRCPRTPRLEPEPAEIARLRARRHLRRRPHHLRGYSKDNKRVFPCI
jgi:hypothetical protein